MVKQNYTDPWKETIDENGSAMYFDEESTVDMAASDDGSRFDGIKMWRLDEHPNKARRRKERLGIWSLLGFFAAMLLFVIPMSLRKKQVVLEEPEPIQATEKNLSVYCNGKKSYDLKEWLKEDTSDSSKLCDPQVSIGLVYFLSFARRHFAQLFCSSIPKVARQTWKSQSRCS